MDKLSEELFLDVAGDIDFSNEAVILDGETGGLLEIYHESFLAKKLHLAVESVGGNVTGDEALYI